MGERWLIVGAHDVDPARNGSALRILQHLENLSKQGHQVEYFKAAPTKPWADQTKILVAPKLISGIIRGLDPNCAFLFGRKVARRLVAKIRDFKPNHVVYCESWMAPYEAYVHRQRPFGFWWYQYLDLHNVESRLRFESTENGNWLSRSTGPWRSKLMYNAERHLTSACDENWTCSQVDRDHVKSLYGAESIVVPNRVNTDHYANVKRCLDRSLGLIGIWSYQPNTEAANILLDQVWPGIPDSRLVFAGKNPTPSMKERGATVLGEVQDTRAALAMIRTVVVPLVSGGGTRLKVLEAMAAGIPIVATGKAVDLVALA